MQQRDSQGGMGAPDGQPRDGREITKVKPVYQVQSHEQFSAPILGASVRSVHGMRMFTIHLSTVILYFVYGKAQKQPQTGCPFHCRF